MRQVWYMASKLEAQEDYVPKHGAKQRKTWYIGRLGIVPHNPSGHNHKVPTSTLTEERSGTVDVSKHHSFARAWIITDLRAQNILILIES